MAQNFQQIQVIERLIGCINYLLENQDEADDAAWWTTQEAQRCLRQLAMGESSQAFTSDELGISVGEQKKLVFASFRGPLDDFQILLQKAVKSLAADAVVSRIQLVLLVGDMKDRIVLEHTFDQKFCRETSDSIKKEIKRKKFRITRTVILTKNCPEQYIRLTGLNRINMLLEPKISAAINLEREYFEPQIFDPEEYDAPVDLQSLVFSVDLYQLVELYNLIGDQLFQNNVRFGIDETMGVEQSIRRTLQREPWHFLLKNGGITLLVQEDESTDAACCTDELILGKLSPDAAPGFSVVNGAQTITTAAQFFYELAYWKEHGDTAEAKRCADHFDMAKQYARVLVKIIQIPRDERAKQLAKEISVSLNRQKPIRMEDIAYTTPAVHQLTEYLRQAREAGQVPYQLLRRGEDVNDGHSMTLIEFVRARIACAGTPGDAWSKGGNELLRTAYQEDGTLGFLRKDLFSEEWLETGEVQAAFRRDYGGVWFAHQTAKAYEKARQPVRSEEELAVINNGKWLFAAALANRYLGEIRPGASGPDFSNFSASFEAIRDKLPEAIPLFARLTVLCAHAYLPEDEINSNLFKKNSLYPNLCGALRGRFSSQDGGCDQEAHTLAERLAELLGFPAVSDQSPAALRTPPFPAAAGVQELPLEAGCVVINGEILKVQTGVQALVQVVTHVLSTYSIDPERLERQLGSWLTRDRSKVQEGVGAFRQCQAVKLPGADTVWVGTSTNSRAKRGQMKALCRLSSVPKGSMCWYPANTVEPLFVW